MPDQLPFAGPGSFFRGNLHTHSTLSDGQKTPEQIVELYKRAGFHFLSLTDHRVYNDHSALSTPDFLLVPGFEMDIFNDEKRQDNHIVCILADKDKPGLPFGTRRTDPGSWRDGMPWGGPPQVQAFIDEMNEKGFLCFWAHPVWSRNELCDFIDYTGLFGVELFNTGCHIENATGYGGDIYWDSALRRGKPWRGFAVDDAHFHQRDYCQGWITVKAEALTWDVILSSIRAGRFYASVGPEISDFGIRDGVAFLDCPRAREIHFVGWHARGKSFVSFDEEGLTHAEFPLEGQDFIRAEVVDFAGRRAWTNPLFL